MLIAKWAYTVVTELMALRRVMLQYGSVEAFVRIVSEVDSEVQSMVRVSPADRSRYRYPSNHCWVLVSHPTACIPAAKYQSHCGLHSAKDALSTIVFFIELLVILCNSLFKFSLTFFYFTGQIFILEKIMIIRTKYRQQCLWFCHHSTATAIVRPVHLLQLAANPLMKPIVLSRGIILK